MVFKGLAALAAFSLSVSPASAAVFPAGGDTRMSAVSAYHGGWRGGHRHRHRDRVDAGDVLAGVLVLGTIAAVANAASKANERRGYPYPPPPRNYRDEGPRGLDGAVDLCLREIERDSRVSEVTRAERNARGWLVSGAMATGEGFSCSIGSDGRIENIDIGGRPQPYAAADTSLPDRQYSDDVYRSARADADNRDYGTGQGWTENADTSGQAQPTYPGGPLPGEEFPEDAPGD